MRLIDADDLAAKIMIDAPDFMGGGSGITKTFIMAMVKTKSVTPTIDAVQVVRCKDCRFWNDDGIITTCEKHIGNGYPGDWFCADGKLRGVMPMEVGDGSRYPMIQMRWWNM